VGDGAGDADAARDRELRELRGSLRILRVVAILLVLGLATLLVASRRSESQSRPEGASRGASSSVIHVGERARLITDQRGLDANQADFFLETPALSVHLHLMGRRHYCPLHIHPRGYEGTLIVEGEADVQHVFKNDGGLEKATRSFGEGVLVASPPACAHAFTNGSPDKILANLVFSSPTFDHNTYLASEADDRIGDGAPTSYSFKDEIRAFVSGTDDLRRIPLGAMAGAMSLLLVRGSTRIEPRASGISVLYVLEGRGKLEDEMGRAFDVVPKDLAIVRSTATLNANPSSVLAALIYVGE
jgi:hypothetical protein